MSFYAMAYKCGWATLDMMRQYVTLGAITPKEFEQITGETV